MLPCWMAGMCAEKHKTLSQSKRHTCTCVQIQYQKCIHRLQILHMHNSPPHNACGIITPKRVLFKAKNLFQTRIRGLYKAKVHSVHDASFQRYKAINNTHCFVFYTACILA